MGIENGKPLKFAPLNDVIWPLTLWRTNMIGEFISHSKLMMTRT